MTKATETRAACPWRTPVRPLTGAARNCVYAGETPPTQIRAASYAFWRQQGYTAQRAVTQMRLDCLNRKTRYPAFHPSINPATSAYGESAVRWIENPEDAGLRFVGLSHDLDSHMRHTGWHLDPDGGGETVAGVVYQLPSKGGRARYLAGYADPWNTDSDGRGPALISCDVIEAESPDLTEWRRVAVSRYGYSANVAQSFTLHEVQEVNNDSAKIEAARQADGIAERMADHEREYQEGYRAGVEARELSNVARVDCAAWVQAVRAARAIFRNRHAIARADLRLLFKAQKEQARDLCRDFLASRDAARAARDNAPAPFMGQDCPALEGWIDGYDNGV